MAAAPALATLLRPLGSRFEAASAGERPQMVHLLMVVPILVLLVLASPWMRSVSPLVPAEQRSLVSRDTPVAAARYLKEHHPPGNMLNTQGFGSYLELAVPELPVFVDSRIEMFPDGLWKDYVTVMSAQPGWEEVLQGYAIGHVVLRSRPAPELSFALERDPGWEKVYSDRVATIYVSRRAP